MSKIVKSLQKKEQNKSETILDQTDKQKESSNFEKYIKRKVYNDSKTLKYFKIEQKLHKFVQFFHIISTCVAFTLDRQYFYMKNIKNEKSFWHQTVLDSKL